MQARNLSLVRDAGESAAPAEWSSLRRDWTLTLRQERYSAESIRTYTHGVRSLLEWLETTGLATTSPTDLTRSHIRGWLADLLDTRSAATATTYYAGVRSFCQWLVKEGETDTDPTAGIRAPNPGEPSTPVLSSDDLKRLLASCAGNDLRSRRDTAILLCLADGGLRLSELAGLRVEDVDLEAKMLFVMGKGTARKGARPRAVPVGVKTTLAISRYLRVRERHPLHDRPELWLGTSHSVLGAGSIRKLVGRRGQAAGIEGLHPHALRHSWASQYRANGGSEGNLMSLGGWRNRSMLDRYGRAAAADRAAQDYHERSLADRL
jgi:site-specific recombinase XerC